MTEKIFTAVVSVVMLLAALSVPMSAFAAAPAQDGVYEVPVEMIRADSDRTSMGNSYIVHTAVLKVDGSTKTLTVASEQKVNDMQFWYYKNGGVDGETVEVSQVGEVEIAGKTYATAFEFPVMSDDDCIGVKFASSLMPLSPSARIKIDYANARLVSGAEETTTQPATQKVTQAPTQNVTQAVVTTMAQTTASSGSQTTEEMTQAVTDVTAEASEGTQSGSKVPVIIGVAAVVIIAAAAVTVIVVKKKKDGISGDENENEKDV